MKNINDTKESSIKTCNNAQTTNNKGDTIKYNINIFFVNKLH